MAATIREAIAETLKDQQISADTEQKIINVFVDREVTKRADAIVKVIDTTVKMENDLRKIKPDQVFYNEDGTVASSNYSKSKLDEKKKLEEKIQKYANAVNKAMDKGDYGDVYNLGAGKDQGSDRGGDSD